MTPDEMATIHVLAFVDERPWNVAEFDDLLGQDGVFSLSEGPSFAVCRQVLDETELLMLATHPEHRRQGLAASLCAAWLDKAQSQGATRAFLEVASDNLAARALYEALGFEEAGRRKAYYTRKSMPAADALTMILDLTKRQLPDSRTSGQEIG